MTFDILIATMKGNFFKKETPIPTNAIIINQYDKEPYTNTTRKNIYNFQEKGLSKSRNQAINISQADICLISDDDVMYLADINKTVIDGFTNNPEADIITFQVQTPESTPFKEYKKEKFWHTKKSIMSVCSIEIAFKRNVIQEKNLKFDEQFGLGSTFPTGEENIFLSDALKKNLNILYIPKPIVVHPMESSGNNYDSIALIEAKGAMFYRMFNMLGYMVSIVFTYKKYSSSTFSFKTFMLLMFGGISKYRSTR